MKEFLKTIIKNDEHLINAVESFTLYRNLLIEWNKKFNLTAITDPQEIEIKHFIDSLCGFNFIEGSVLDIGTGAGFPSIPLKIVLPEHNFMLVDSLNKRVNFLNEVICALDLKRIKAVHSRAEDLPKDKKYDTAVARAVAPLNVLCEYILPFVKIGGKMIAYKSFDIEDEINLSKPAIKILGAKIEKVEEIPLFGTDIIRKLVIIRKETASPLIYPRVKNQPKTHPLT